MIRANKILTPIFWKEFFRKIKPKQCRRIIIADGENIYFALDEEESERIGNFSEFGRRLANGEKLATLPIYYRSVDEKDSGGTKKFLDDLKSQGWEVKTKPILKGKDPKSEIDPMIAADICRFAADKHISTIVLVSGDRHFIDAVKFAKEKKKRVIVVSLESTLSEDLKKASDEWVDLRKIITGIAKKSEMAEKRKEAMGKLKKGNTVILSTLETKT